MRAEASKYSGWDVNLITAIAEAESHCKVDATGDKKLTYQKKGRTYGYSMSVMQVRIMEGREHCDKHDLQVNIKCAYAVWQGQGYKAWTMYTNGEYKKYL